MGFGAGAGGDGEFVARFSSAGQNIATSSSGILVTLTPPAGQKVRLNILHTTSSTETGITVKVGATEVINSKTLTDYSTGLGDNLFTIGEITAVATVINTRGIIPPIVGKVDEVIEIIKDTGSTSLTIGYNYQFGE